MAKRGRPKSDRPAIDYGTPESIAKRAAIVSVKTKGKITLLDPALSTCPLDALKAKGLVSNEAHAAASHFLACRAITFGSPHPSAVNLLQGQSVGGGERDDGDKAKIERRYRAACAAMHKRGRAVLDAIENLVVHERWPEWLFSHARSKSKDRCMEGFAALLSWHKAA